MSSRSSRPSPAPTTTSRSPRRARPFRRPRPRSPARAVSSAGSSAASGRLTAQAKASATRATSGKRPWNVAARAIRRSVASSTSAAASIEPQPKATSARPAESWSDAQRTSADDGADGQEQVVEPLVERPRPDHGGLSGVVHSEAPIDLRPSEPQALHHPDQDMDERCEQRGDVAEHEHDNLRYVSRQARRVHHRGRWSTAPGMRQ